MKTWQIAVVGLLPLAMSGCKSDPEIARLEQENRRYQDQIYSLRDQLEYTQSDLQAEQAKVRKLQASGKAERKSDSGSRLTPSEKPADTSGPPTELVPPAVMLPGEAVPEGQIPERFQVPGSPKDSRGQPPAERPKPESTAPGWNKSTGARFDRGPELASAAKVLADSAAVTRITLNKSLTGGNAHGDLFVAIEPRDGHGRVLDAPGALQVVALDPALSGQQARVGGWELTAAETSAQLQSSRDRGIHVMAPLPKGPPTRTKLHLYVRYWTSDGRKLETDGIVETSASGNRTAGWVPAAEQREVESAPPPSIPTVRLPEVQTERMATGRDEAGPPRPVWSPERL